MKPPRRAIFLIVPLAILLIPLAVYGMDRITSRDEIARNVTIAGVAVGGLNETDATVAVRAHEQALRQSTGVFVVNGVSFKLSPVAVGLTADTGSAVDSAMRTRRDGNPVENFVSWIASFSKVEDVPLDVALSETAIDEQLDEWEAEAIPNAAFEGAVFVADEAVKAEYPRSGEAIDRTMAHEAIRVEMSTLEKSGVPLTVATVEPVLTAEDIDATVAELEAMIDDEVTLRSNEVGFRTSFSASQLASAARADLNEAGDAFVTSFDEQRVLEILEPRRGEFEIQPIDAAFDIDVNTDRIRVIPGRSGTLLDVPALLIELKRAALADGTGVFPIVVGAEPAFTTEEAETYTSLVMLSEFTTNHPAREDRVVNIQQIARDVDGAIVQPGAEWSVNEWVGQRTEAKGYIPAPAIINGEPYCCDHPANIGGGVSQFGTTIFNAIFYACLEDIEHRPHTLHISRYPKGLEATLGYPHPDVRFRNNTDAPVIIKTAYTDTSITVKMYGDNGGKKCTALTSEAEQIVAFTEELVADTEGVVEPGSRVKERTGIDGFLVRVERLVTYPDGREEIDLRLPWRYSALSERYIVHRCEVSGQPVNCPVKLPSLVNATWEGALATLQDLGLLASRTFTAVDNPDRDGVVVSQNPLAGEWVAPGSTISLTVGEYSGEPDDDDDE